MSTPLIDPRVPAVLTQHLFACRLLPDGRRLDAYPRTFGAARLGIAPDYESVFYDDTF